MSKKYNGVYAQIGLKYNVTYKLTDKNGNVKPLFQVNALGKFLLNLFRKFITEPIDSKTSQVKAGWTNHLSAYGLRIPHLTGNWVNEMTIANLVPTAGKAAVASRINGAGSEAVFASIGMGTGATAPAAGDTALQTEVTASGTGASGVHVIAAATATRVTTTVTNDTAQLVGTVNITGTIAVTESGVFNATTNGTILCRQTFSAINVINGDSLQFTWKVACA